MRLITYLLGSKVSDTVVSDPPKQSINGIVAEDNASPTTQTSSFIESINGTLLAKQVIRSEHPATHSDVSWATQHIEARPYGSEKNGPASADFALSVSAIKRNWGSATLTKSGEIDAINVIVRQSGPTTVSGVATADCVALLADVQNAGQCGFAAAAETTTSNVTKPGFAFTRKVNNQIGVINTTDQGQESYGYVANSTYGDNDVAYYAQAKPGCTWGAYFQAFSEGLGTTVFSVGDDEAIFRQLTVLMPSLPTSSSGLPSGALWVDTANGNVLKRIT